MSTLAPAVAWNLSRAGPLTITLPAAQGGRSIVVHSCLRCGASWPCPTEASGRGRCLAARDVDATFVCSRCVRLARGFDGNATAREPNGRKQRAVMGRMPKVLAEAVQGP